jgi:hypothetical protein
MNSVGAHHAKLGTSPPQTRRLHRASSPVINNAWVVQNLRFETRIPIDPNLQFIPQVLIVS